MKEGMVGGGWVGGYVDWWVSRVGVVVYVLVCVVMGVVGVVGGRWARVVVGADGLGWMGGWVVAREGGRLVGGGGERSAGLSPAGKKRHRAPAGFGMLRSEMP